MWRLVYALSYLFSRQTNFSLSRYGYWMSSNGTMSHSSFAASRMIAISILALLRMACLRSTEPAREFVAAVTSTEAVSGILYIRQS